MGVATVSSDIRDGILHGRKAASAACPRVVHPWL